MKFLNQKGQITVRDCKESGKSYRVPVRTPNRVLHVSNGNVERIIVILSRSHGHRRLIATEDDGNEGRAVAPFVFGENVLFGA